MRQGTPSLTLKTSIATLLACVVLQPARAATIVTTPTGGDWADPATWTGGIVPTNVDRVDFANAPAVTVSVTTPQEAAAIYASTTVGGANNYTLNVSSDLAVGTISPLNLFNNVSFFVGTLGHNTTVNQTAGNVTIGNKLSIAPDGGTSVYNLNGGLLQFTSGNVANREISIGNNSGVNGAGGNGGDGTLNIRNGAQVISAGVVRLGSLANGTARGHLLLADTASLAISELIGNRGDITITGGTLFSTGRMILGWTSNAPNRADVSVNMSGGDVTFQSTSPFNFANYIGVDNGDATFTVSGGSLHLTNGVAGHLHIGANAGTSNGTLTVSGGEVEVGTRISIGTGYPGEVAGSVGDNGNGSGTLTISGTGRLRIGTGSGGDSDKGSLYLKSPNGGSGTAVVNLDGGRIELARFAIGSGGTSKTINFNGGTIVPTASRADFLDLSLSGNTTLNVKDGGAVFDTNGFNITVNGDLVNGGTGAGGLIKNGAGQLTLASTNHGYGGPTVVNAGALAIGGTYTAPFTFANNTRLVPRAGAIGTLTVPNLTLGTGMTFDFELGAGGLSDTVVISNSGGLTFAGGSFNFFSEGTTLPFSGNGTYTLFDYNTTFTGSLAGVTFANAQPGKSYSLINDTTATAIKLMISDTGVPTWNLAGGGSWNVAGNWAPNGVPNGAGVVAKFGNSITTASTVNVAGAKTVGGLVFDSANAYTIAGSAADTITLNNSGSAASISVASGNHTIAAPLVLASDATLTTGVGSSLLVSGVISGPNALSTNGSITLTAANT
jgi:autotransporter-associated beta strand protein